MRGSSTRELRRACRLEGKQEWRRQPEEEEEEEEEEGRLRRLGEREEE